MWAIFRSVYSLENLLENLKEGIVLETCFDQIEL